MAKTQHEDSDQSSETITRIVGTFGYLAPEYAESGKVSTKTDVYAFGVVLLQLITGMKTTDKRLGGKSLVGWVKCLNTNLTILKVETYVVIPEELGHLLSYCYAAQNNPTS